jgi:2-polyprenyl-3-methyl-5-hydroxy-6-metoxy-1,4-benzoquinol methylase
MSEVWGSVWNEISGIEFGKEPYMWKFYEILLGDYDFRGKRVLELGCGTGINTILMALRGARVTLLDYSKEALGIAGKVLEGFSQKGELVHGNALDHGFENEFDLVHSEGVVEHFLGKERQGIIDSHSQALKKNGRAVIIAPNSGCPPYRIGKFLSEKLGVWMHGGEYPFSRKELEFRFRNSGLRVDKNVGGEFVFSFGWFFSPIWLINGKVLKKSIQQPANEKIVKMNYNNFLANRWGRVLGVVGRKV